MGDIRGILDRARKELLELTTRNRLLDTPHGRARALMVEVVDERSTEIFDLLVGQGRKLGFLARPESPETQDHGPTDDPFVDLAPPEEDDLDAAGGAARHRDLWLQTPLLPERLQSRLLRLYYDARTIYEERGVNVLYLALGFLEWYEAPSSDQARNAPLILIPVALERGSAHESFRLLRSDDEIISNITLREKLKEFGLHLPDIEDADDLRPAGFFSEVARAIAGEPRFRIQPDHMVLGLFSFSRLLMYRDLDPTNWPAGAELEGQPLVRAVLVDGFRDEPEGVPNDRALDEVLSPQDAVHVLDADSSQTTAIEDVRRGRDLLIQGPPGTGKSQTIANIIASAVKDGKKVLFVAEKMAALEVVHRRLNDLGLGDMCLELHSHKANKRALLKDLRHTLELGLPRRVDMEALPARLAETRARLNEHAAIMHSVIGRSDLTPFTAIGEMVRLARKRVTHIDFDLPGASGWTGRDIEERQALIGELSAQVSRMGTPAECVWRGVHLASVLPSDQARITEQVTALASRLTQLRETVRSLERGLELCERTSTLAQIRQLLETCRYLASAPQGVDDDALHHPVWREQREVLAELVELGQTASAGRARLQAIVVDKAWSADLGGLRRDLAAHSRSWLRWLNPTYWRARSAVASVLMGPSARSIDKQVALLDELLEVIRAEERVAAEGPCGGSAFGRLWQNETSDWTLLAKIERWERAGRDDRLLPDAPRLLSRLDDRAGLLAFAGQIIQHLDASRTACQELFARLGLNLDEAFGQPKLDEIDLDVLLSRVEGWQGQVEDLNAWLSYGRLIARAREHGLGPLVERLHDSRLNPEAALDAFAFAICEPLMREALDRFPSLAEFDGRSHDELIERFRRLDGKRIGLAADEVALAHFRGLPRGDGALGEMRVLRHEFNKMRRHLPIRKLMAQAAQAVQAIKPVFMMSPLSVAEFLPPGALRFDLLLIDEASQVEPVDALGAIARADRMAVVGDNRQLPPTRFFKGRLVDDEQPDDDAPPVAEIESILGKCDAQGIPQRMLEWHYRSRHPSLIEVSNKHFYNSRLFIVPNAHPDNPELGLRFHHLPDAVYDRGGSRMNRIEAKAVAQAVMRHARKHADLSLGVGCFSVAQRDAILHELEVARRLNRASESFFASHSEEPFFVKNLENIQGDERDVILISVGYGRDASGYMAMSFGPLNADGGERRLNVLITRAKQRCQVLSSITADDIDLSRASNPGVAALKAFLKYAETGIVDVPRPTGREADSVFEEQVASALEGLGHKVDAQVGTAGFFINLAIRDPTRPGRYLLGVECDGATYCGSAWNKDPASGVIGVQSGPP